MFTTVVITVVKIVAVVIILAIFLTVVITVVLFQLYEHPVSILQISRGKSNIEIIRFPFVDESPEERLLALRIFFL